MRLGIQKGYRFGAGVFHCSCNGLLSLVASLRFGMIPNVFYSSCLFLIIPISAVRVTPCILDQIR